MIEKKIVQDNLARKYKNFSLIIDHYIAHVTLNRPQKSNALDRQAWEELKIIFEYLDRSDKVRVIILAGTGKHFCAGIDLSLLMSLHQVVEDSCEGRKREKIRFFVLELQAAVNAIEKCRKPVVAAIHGGCIGAGVDIVAACDMRYAAEEAYFCIKEIDLGMVADLGTLQRLPKIIPYAAVCEMAYTGRKVGSVEAASMFLVNKTFKNKAEMMEEVQQISTQIAQNSPLSVRGSKQILQYSRDHSVSDALDYMATWNAAMLLSDDLKKAFEAKMTGNKAVFLD
jgi:enoyl-CoA hydratase